MTATQQPFDGDTGFVPDWADRVERFFSKVLVHTKGRWARVPFNLTDWQSKDMIRPLFGSARYDGQIGAWVRLYNEAWFELGRGDGKSEVLAGIALYLLCADGEEAAEVYGAAKDKDQAALVFNVAKRMVKLSPILSQQLTIVDSRKRIIDPDTDSVYQVVAADAAGNLGQDPHGIVFDEIVAQPSRDLYDALRTGQGKRTQSLLVCATTAGNDPESFAAHEHNVALSVAEEPAKQPNRLVVIRNTPRRVPLKEARKWTRIRGSSDGETVEVDPFAERNWHHANPAIKSGFLSLATLRSEAAAAKADPAKENAFRQFRLNQWVSKTTRALSLQQWDATAGMVAESKLEGRTCFGGLDLAATTDLAALALLFSPLDPEAPPDTPEGEMPFLWRYWVPAGAVAALDKASGGRFTVWDREGFLTITDEELIDYDDIHAQIDKDRRLFGLIDLSLDPWNSASTITWCEKQRITTAAVSQTYRSLSPPTKEFLRIIKLRRLRHGGNPVTRYNIDGFELKMDPAENVRPVKPNRQKSGKRIDGVLAAILALDGYMRRGARRTTSVYEDRGLDVV